LLWCTTQPPMVGFMPKGRSMRRRDFIQGIASSAVAWPLAARAEQADKLRRIGVLMGLSEDNPENRSFLDAFIDELAKLGWKDGGTVRIEQR
jgi:putative tryptophan/tyrosine transport system substrate-binding protein